MRKFCMCGIWIVVARRQIVTDCIFLQAIISPIPFAHLTMWYWGSSHWEVRSVFSSLRFGQGLLFASTNSLRQKGCYVASKARSLGDACQLHSDKACHHAVRKPRLAQVERTYGKELRLRPTASLTEEAPDDTICPRWCHVRQSQAIYIKLCLNHRFMNK